MSEAKTMGEAWVGDGHEEKVATTALRFLSTYGDYRIVGPGSVVSLKGLEAVAKTLHRLFTTALVVCWDEVPAKEKGDWLARARAALEAAGIVVADEVVEVRAHPEESIAVPIVGEGCPRPQVMLLRDDKLYIERATVTSCDKEE